MPPVITESDRKTDNRGVSPPWATEPVWATPSRASPSGGTRYAGISPRWSGRRSWYARPDGSQLETTWVNESSAKVWAEMNGLRYLGRVPDRTETPAPPPPDFGGRRTRATEAPLSPPAIGEGGAGATATTSTPTGGRRKERRKARSSLPPPEPEQAKPPPKKRAPAASFAARGVRNHRLHEGGLRPYRR